MPKNHPSSTNINSSIEALVVKKLELQSAKGIKFFEARVDLDGQDEYGFYEIYTRVGEVKVGSVRKVMTDAIKLFFVAQNNRKKGKTIIFVDKAVEKRFLGKSWQAVAIKKLGVQLKTVKIPAASRKLLKEARASQTIGQGITKIK